MPQITISTETLVAAGIVAVAIVVWSYARQQTDAVPSSSGSTLTTSKKKGKKTKSKKSDEKVTESTPPKGSSKVDQKTPHQLAKKVEDQQAPSFAAVTASSGDTTPKPKTLAEKKATKPRKTKVDE